MASLILLQLSNKQSAVSVFPVFKFHSETPTVTLSVDERVRNRNNKMMDRFLDSFEVLMLENVLKSKATLLRNRAERERNRQISPTLGELQVGWKWEEKPVK